MTRWLVGAMVTVVVVAAGCSTPKWAAATTSAPERFPKKSELAEVALRSPKLDVARLGAVAVDSWTLEGPFPAEASLTLVKPLTPWELALVQAVPAIGNVLSVDLQCYAREYARFQLARDAAPGNSLQDFMERRCGTTATRISVNTLQGELPEGVTDAQWLEQWKPQLGALAGKLSTPDAAGLSVRREGKKGLVVLATAEVGVRLTQGVPLVGSKGTVVVRGRLAVGGAERIEALINKGALEVEPCKTLDALRPPEFAFECPVTVTDGRTSVALAAFDPGRILGRRVAHFLLWPAGTPELTWRRPEGSADVSDADFNPQFLAAVNKLRAGANLPLLSEAKEQSATAAMLAPHYFAATFGESADPLETDRIALGMMAGWDVGQDLVTSGFGSEWISGTRDLSVMLEFLLEDPFTRQSLTNPRATMLAAGTVKGTGSSLASIFATYVPLGAFDRKASEIAIITRLNQLRLDRQMKLAQWTLWPTDEGARVEAMLGARRWSPDDALGHVLQATADIAKGQVTGYVQLVDDLEHFQFPPEVLLRPDINVFLAVGVYRGESWAQSRYVVCFVIAQSGLIETASR